MKMNQKKKKIKNKIKKESIVITPELDIKISYKNLHSEEVANYIIELLISSTISIEFVKNTEKKINNICLDEIHKKIINITQLYNINHDIDDFESSENITSSKNILKTDENEKRYKVYNHRKLKDERNFYANKALYNSENINKLTQTEMLIKNKEIKDLLNKSINMKINYELLKINKIQYDIIIKKHNYWGNIPEPKSYFIDRTSSFYNQLKIDKKNLNTINTKEKTKKKKTKKKYSLFYKRVSKPLIEEMELKKKKFVPILQMPFVELSKEESKNKETEEIKKMREETIQILEAKKENLKLLGKKGKNLENLEIKGKFTTDIEGKIVMINEIKPEKLLKEFIPISSKQKELLSGKPLQALQEENELLEKKAKKNIIFNKVENNNYFLFPNFLLNKNLNDDKNNKDNNNNKDKNIKNKDNRNSIKNNKDNNEDKNDNNKDIKSENNNNINKETNKNINKKNITLNINKLKKVSLNSIPFAFPHPYRLNERIIIGGSNFNIMEPSPGVNIQENNSIKKGEISYFKVYHKYSLGEFNQALRENLNFEKPKFTDNFSNNNIIPIKKEELKSPNNNLNMKKIIVQHQYSDRNKNKFRKTFTEIFRNKNYLKNSMRSTTLNEKDPNKLKFILMRDDDNNEINIRKIKKLGKASSYNNIFSRNISARLGIKLEKNKKFKLNIVDKFNKDLIKGHVKNEIETNALPRLPPKNIIIVNKLITNIKGMNRTMSNFHRTRRKGNLNNEFIPSLS